MSSRGRMEMEVRGGHCIKNGSGDVVGGLGERVR